MQITFSALSKAIFTSTLKTVMLSKAVISTVFPAHFELEVEDVKFAGGYEFN